MLERGTFLSDKEKKLLKKVKPLSEEEKKPFEKAMKLLKKAKPLSEEEKKLLEKGGEPVNTDINHNQEESVIWKEILDFVWMYY